MPSLSQVNYNPEGKRGALEPETLEKHRLVSLTTNDVATEEIEGDLLSVPARGEVLVKSNVKDQLVNKSVKFFEPLKKNNSRNFGTLYKTKVTTAHNETKVVKADRKLIQQLLNASRAGRDVQLEKILEHELSCLPLSFSKTDGQMNATSKLDLLGILSTDMDVATPSILPSFNGRACAIVDGHALIQALGKPKDCQSFGDYGNVFYKTVVRQFSTSVQRVDVVFYRYRPTSIKGPTRNKRAKGKKKPIRRIIDRSDVPLPQVWEQFISLDENKADLARFLSEYMMMKCKDLPGDQELITAGGFTEERQAQSSLSGNNPRLSANHEEADTRLILHSLNAVEAGFHRIQVLCRDTDVLLMLLHFFPYKDIEVWMIGGSSKEQKCYPVHQIVKKLSQPVIENLLGFHAITGCDTCSSFTGFGKKATWKVYVGHPHLLQGVGRHTGFDETQEFVCRLYNAPDPLGGVNKGSHDIFVKGKKSLEMLPPTRDALELHWKRSNYQANIWLQSGIPDVVADDPSACGGWSTDQAGLVIVWSRILSIPKACIELISCGCQTKCRRANCKCYISRQVCTPACGCNAVNCCNPAGQFAE